MPLPVVAVHGAPGEPPTVVVDGAPIGGVRSAQITVTDGHLPQVSLVLHAATVAVDLPAGVTVLTTGSAVDFADALSPARLEGDALERLGLGELTHGEAFAAAVRAQAAEFDADRG